MPRTGAFELSWDGILIYSKCLSSMWPHFPDVAKKAAKMMEDVEKGAKRDDLVHKYLTNGGG